MTEINYPSKDNRQFWKEKSSDEIAEFLGVHRNTIARFRKKHRLPSPKRRGGPGRTARIDKRRIDLNKTAAWNAQRLKCSENWMFQLMSAMRKEQAGLFVPKRKVSKKKPVKKQKQVVKETPAADEWA